MCQPGADSRVCWVKYGSWCQGGAEDHGRFWRCASAPSGALGQLSLASIYQAYPDLSTAVQWGQEKAEYPFRVWDEATFQYVD